MKKWAAYIPIVVFALFGIAQSADLLKTTLNPFTGKFDYIQNLTPVYGQISSNKSRLSLYSSHRQPEIDSKLPKSTHSQYSANRQPEINSKLSSTTFNNYTLIDRVAYSDSLALMQAHGGAMQMIASHTQLTGKTSHSLNTVFTNMSTQIYGKVSKTAFTNNSTYTAAHIRALVDPHPAAGSNRQIQYNSGGSFTGAAMLNYSGGNVGAGTSNPQTPLHVSGTSTSPSRGLMVAQHNDGTQAASLVFRKSRGTEVAPIKVKHGDFLGGFNPSAYEGTAYQTPATVLFGIMSSPTTLGVKSGSTPTGIAFYTGNHSNGGGGNRAERFRVTPDGKISTGGNAAPLAVFHISSSASGRARLITGNPTTTNAVIEDQNLGIRFKGNAIQWDDVVVPLSGTKAPASSSPTWTSYKSSEVPSFSATATNQLFFSMQLPHGYQEGADISCHIHVAYATNNGGNSRWQLTHSWANVNTALPAATTITSTFASPSTTDQHAIHDFGTLTGIGKTISSVILFSLARLGADAADTHTGAIYGLSFDCHVPKDSIGSDAATSKTATP